MKSLQQVLLLSFGLALLFSAGQSHQDPVESKHQEELMETLDICEEQYRMTATPAQVEAAYEDLLQVQDERLKELLNTSLDRFIFALEDSKDNEPLHKKVVLEYYDKICGVVEVVADMSEKVLNILS